MGTSLPTVSTCPLLCPCLLLTLTNSILSLLLVILLRDELLDWILSGMTSSSSLIKCEEIAVINLTDKADQKAYNVSRRLLEVKGKIMLVSNCDVIKTAPDSKESFLTSYVLMILCATVLLYPVAEASLELLLLDIKAKVYSMLLLCDLLSNRSIKMSCLHLLLASITFLGILSFLVTSPSQSFLVYISVLGFLILLLHLAFPTSLDCSSRGPTGKEKGEVRRTRVNRSDSSEIVNTTSDTADTMFLGGNVVHGNLTITIHCRVAPGRCCARYEPETSRTRKENRTPGPLSQTDSDGLATESGC